MNAETLLGRSGRFSADALDAVRAAQRAIAAGTIRKDASNVPGFDETLGLYAYSLEAPAKLLYPVTSPLRNRLARNKPSQLSRYLQWKKITAINTGGAWASVAFGARGTVLRKSEKDITREVKTVGLEESIEDEARLFATDYQDLNALANLTLLQSLMEKEEDLIIGGNTTTALATPGVPSGTTAITGGALPAATTYKAKVTALTMQGLRAMQASGFDPELVSGQTLAGAESAGVLTGAGAINSITWSWADVPGAVAYAVWVQKTAGSFFFSNFVQVNKYLFTTDTVSVKTAAGVLANTTVNASDFDGIVANYESVDSLADVTSLDGASLTSDGAGGVLEFTDAFKRQFEANGAGPTEIWMGATNQNKVRQLVSSSTAPVYRVDVTAGDMNIKGGIKIGSVMNPFTDEDVPILTHRRIPAGLIIGLGLSNPYGYSNLGQSMDLGVLRDYYRRDFAETTRAIQFGIFSHEVLRVYFDGNAFLIKNATV